jgi:hypothetical protein
LCPCCASRTKKVENELPQNELWQLYRAAYEQYQSVIIKGEKSYSRYVNDFIYYHLPCTSIREADIRLHFMHVFDLKELLEERRDLVDAFFSKDSFEEKDFLLMDDLFNKGKSHDEPESVYLAHFSDEQIRIITNFVRSTSLFKSEVTESDIKDLFECRLSVPLQAKVNRHVAIFFGKLREHGLLPYSWQMIMESHKLVSSSANNEPLRASQLRCGLSQARVANLRKKPNSNILDDGIGFYDSCDVFIKKLKECL